MTILSCLRVCSMLVSEDKNGTCLPGVWRLPELQQYWQAVSRRHLQLWFWGGYVFRVVKRENVVLFTTFRNLSENVWLFLPIFLLPSGTRIFLIYHFCFPSFVLWIQVTTIHGHFLSSILALNHHFCVVIGKYRGFHVGSTGKESASNAGDPDVILGLGRYPGEGIGYPLCSELSWWISG